MSPGAAKERKVALAAVAGAHGVKGEVRLKLFATGVDSLSAPCHAPASADETLQACESIRGGGGKGAVARFTGDRRSHCR